ncbi:MAG TPA: ribonuclease E/G, partial [Vicingus sp.]|nr:ribonuclease E/G [Vicingus sp.]
ADLHTDMDDLTKKWELCYNAMKDAHAPKKVLGELDRTSALLRDLLNSDFNSITVNDDTLYNELRTYLHTIAPDKEKIVKQYTGKMPIFDNFGVEKQIKSLFGRNVTLKSGIYLIIEHTEALHVIDVNSGQRGKRQDSTQEQNALEVNLEAAEEVARQLRLRDMGGIVVVDFIDMKESENRQLLYEKMKEFMKDDRAKHNILPPSKFGLVQITRQRVRPEMEIKTSEKCPSCGGSGEVQSTVLLVEEIENNIRYITQHLNMKTLKINVHPFVEAFINKRKGLFSSLRKEWQNRFKCSLEIMPTTSYNFLQYKFFDKNDEEIHL